MTSEPRSGAAPTHMIKRHFSLSLSMSLAVLPSRAVPALSRTIEIPAGDGFQFRLQEALISAPAGSTVLLPEGRFLLNDELSVSRPFLTIRGRGADKTILDFKGQITGAQGIIATGDGTDIEDLSVLNTAGDSA